MRGDERGRCEGRGVFIGEQWAVSWGGGLE